MMLEDMADADEQAAYPLPLEPWLSPGEATTDVPRFMLDWGPLLEAVIEDSRRGMGVGMIAARFHNAMAQGIVRVAREVGQSQVALSGGCFQNRLLTLRATELLEADGFEVLRHRQVPANDGGLSLGQIAVAAAQMSRG